MKFAPAVEVRALIARLLIPRGEGPTAIGRVDLFPHQMEGVIRALRAIEGSGGVLLCDAVGLGKTFTAAAVMRHFESSVVIAPAALREMWEESLCRAGVTAAVVSVEQFSSLPPAGSAPELVVIDEAHHFRNPKTRRFKNVATFVEHSRVLLLSATPIHNRAGDITSLLSLFLGTRAESLTAAEMAACVIRRQRSSANSYRLPVRHPVQAVNPPVSVEIRRGLLSLPPPVPPRDGSECATLVQITLLRQWASSDAALRAGLESRTARAAALIASLEAGTYPTRKELSTWSATGLDVQLGFAELLAAPGGDRKLLETVQDHDAATRALLNVLSAEPSSDQWRANYLRGVRTRYPSRKVVAFTQFAATARELYRILRNDPKVALITSARCEIASGRVTRRDVIERFAPRGSSVRPPVERGDITMLLATDLCSEGLNLQDAGVIVHLDMPWTAARVEQRIGRIARPGSRHREIFIHTIRIPKIADDLLRMEQRLRQKTLISLQILGANEECPPCEAIPAAISPADAEEHVIGILKSWDCDSTGLDLHCPVAFCDIAQENDCFVAAVRTGAQTGLICGNPHRVTSDPRELLAALAEVTTADVPGDPVAASAVAVRILDWLAQNRLAKSLDSGKRTTVARSIARRISGAARTAPIHSRPAIAAAADCARRALNAPRTAGLELRLSSLKRDSGSDDQWLARMAALEPEVHKKETGSIDGSGFEILALLIGRKRTSG